MSSRKLSKAQLVDGQKDYLRPEKFSETFQVFGALFVVFVVFVAKLA
jgi:hypothetical protein